MIGVVFVHYRIPDWRLEQHFKWNGRFYESAGAKVFVVADQVYQVPPYAECLIYPPMEIFNLSATKNHGINAALAAGCDPIAVVDTDVAWSRNAWNDALGVQRGELLFPVCMMARTFEKKERDSHPDRGMGCCMTAVAEHWQKARYDERFIGYGSDDAVIRINMRKAGARELRMNNVYHIAHDPGKSQVNPNGHGRADCWNRDTGFNPDMASRNNKLFETEPPAT